MSYKGLKSASLVVKCWPWPPLWATSLKLLSAIYNSYHGGGSCIFSTIHVWTLKYTYKLQCMLHKLWVSKKPKDCLTSILFLSYVTKYSAVSFKFWEKIMPEILYLSCLWSQPSLLSLEAKVFIKINCIFLQRCIM